MTKIRITKLLIHNNMKFTHIKRNSFTLSSVPVPVSLKRTQYAGTLIRSGLLDGVSDTHGKLLTGCYDDDSFQNDCLMSLRSTQKDATYHSDRFDHYEHLTRSGVVGESDSAVSAKPDESSSTSGEDTSSMSE